MAGNDELLSAAGQYRVGDDPGCGEVTRIELRTDGHGLSGHYDMIYIYTAHIERPWVAMPAHNVASWEYL